MQAGGPMAPYHEAPGPFPHLAWPGLRSLREVSLLAIRLQRHETMVSLVFDADEIRA